MDNKIKNIELFEIDTSKILSNSVKHELKKGSDKEAFDFLKFFIALHPENGDIWISLCFKLIEQVCRDQKNAALVLMIFEYMVKAIPYMGKKSFSSKNKKKCEIKKFRTTLKNLLSKYSQKIFNEDLSTHSVSPIQFEELIKFSKLCDVLGNTDDAILFLKKALELRPNDQSTLKKISAKTSIPSNVTDLIQKITAIKNKVSFQINLYAIETIRGEVDIENTYNIGDPILIAIKGLPSKDGYLTVFHLYDKSNIEVIFPENNDDETKISSGNDVKIGLIAKAPKGEHYLKAFWTKQQIIDPKSINFSVRQNMNKQIESFFSSIRKLNDADWMEAIISYQVI